jgi:hypothetical protein
MADFMVDMGMQFYDQDRDGKLSFAEWCTYAEDDRTIKEFVRHCEQPYNEMLQAQGHEHTRCPKHGIPSM